MDRPFIVQEKGDCGYCKGKGKRYIWKGRQYVEDGDCYDCGGTGKVDREVSLEEALRAHGLLDAFGGPAWEKDKWDD